MLMFALAIFLSTLQCHTCNTGRHQSIKHTDAWWILMLFIFSVHLYLTVTPYYTLCITHCFINSPTVHQLGSENIMFSYHYCHIAQNVLNQMNNIHTVNLHTGTSSNEHVNLTTVTTCIIMVCGCCNVGTILLH